MVRARKNDCGSFELICGPMGCGKTEELLRLINRASIAGKDIRIFSPKVDTREGKAIIKSRNGLYHEAIKIGESKEILDYIKNEDLIAFDELQFFDSDIVSIINMLMKIGKQVIGTGLELDFKGEPFGQMPFLLCIATKVNKLPAICIKCKNEFGTRTQRLINGQPASKTEPQITIEGEDKNETYEARCIRCHEVY